MQRILSLYRQTAKRGQPSSISPCMLSDGQSWAYRAETAKLVQPSSISPCVLSDGQSWALQGWTETQEGKALCTGSEYRKTLLLFTTFLGDREQIFSPCQLM